jgi:hypothetical protein
VKLNLTLNHELLLIVCIVSIRALLAETYKRNEPALLGMHVAAGSTTSALNPFQKWQAKVASFYSIT